MVQKFKKKPLIIEAVQWTGQNVDEITGFIGYEKFQFEGDDIVIQTYEGLIIAGIGDWIIKGIAGEFYPCKPDIFEKTYEAV